MGLSPEDNLRLNVLLRQNLEAVRIDDSKMTVHALTDKGEAKVPLNPNSKDEAYLKEVRQLFSTHVLGSPGGYPVYLKRWTRMGQNRSEESLKQLLLLGENEAVVAVVHAPVLTDEVARRAWWITPNSENARRMLEKEVIAKGEMGPVLADFLIEFLPFEEDQLAMIDSVRLVLQPGLINDKQRQSLWDRGQRRASFYIGFLKSLPDDLPEQATASPSHESISKDLDELITAGHPVASQLHRVTSASGQAFLETTVKVIKKLNNQDAAVALFEAIQDYFAGIPTDSTQRRQIEEIITVSELNCNQLEDATAVINKATEYEEKIRAMLILSMVSEQLLAPVFGQTDAIGTVMRKKLAPITSVLLEQIKILQT